MSANSRTDDSRSADTFSKMLTAAGFQLKGSGWYATDFKNSGKPKDSGKPAADKSAANSSGNSGDSGKTDTAADTKTEPKAETKTETKTESKTEAKPAASGGTGTTPAAG